mgnify:CR=1 FL=1
MNEINPVGTVVVASRLLNTTTPVNRIEVGDLFDTQRRRENRVLEARAFADV